MLARHQRPFLTNARSFSAIYSPSADSAIAAGEMFELKVTATNQGNRDAIIRVYLDETSQPLWRWCKLSSQNLALATGQSSQINLQIPIPVDTPPGVYSYLVVVDAARTYPQSNPLQHRAKLTVLPPIQSVVKVNDPTFNLLPTSSSTKPIALPVGDKIELEVIVNNRSNRVDRFRLKLIDLPASWWKVTYPEGIRERGLVEDIDSLALNPRSTATIKLQIHPPPTAKAGQYSSTVRLQSSNLPDLVLLDIIYFQIAPDNRLDWELKSLVAKVSKEPGKFILLLHNRGNILRQVRLAVKEEREKPICDYTLASEIELLPKSDRSVELVVKPKQRWRRPWWGKGTPLEFQVECQDVHQLPLSPQQQTGTLVWQARPWWHLALVILAIAGSLTGLGFIVWWLLKPPAPPEIVEFGAESSIYRAANGDSIALSWQISHPRQIANISLLGRSPDGKVTSEAVSFNFSQGLPEELTEFCILQRVLNCRNIPTDARQPGDYLFELIVASSAARHPEERATTNTITIQPLPSPQITQLQAKVADDNTIYLDFALSNTEQITAIELTGFTPEGVVNYPTQQYSLIQGEIAELQSYCQQQERTLVCKRVPLSIISPDRYVFELAAIQDMEGTTTTVARQQSAPVAIATPPIPQLANLTSARPTYQAGIDVPVLLNWDIIHPERLAALKLIGRSSEGVVNALPVTYDFSQGIPSRLQEYCYVTEIISCRNVPTQALETGDYIFELTSFTSDNPNLANSSITSDLIKIESITLPPPPPSPLEILSFEIDGREAPPKYIVQIDPQEPTPSLSLSWNILSDPAATVELLPAPGKVKPQDSLVYPVSERPTTETLTLRVTNPDGRQLERSLIIETTVTDNNNSSSRPNQPQGDRQVDILVPQDLSPQLD